MSGKNINYSLTINMEVISMAIKDKSLNLPSNMLLRVRAVVLIYFILLNVLCGVAEVDFLFFTLYELKNDRIVPRFGSFED